MPYINRMVVFCAAGVVEARTNVGKVWRGEGVGVLPVLRTWLVASCHLSKHRLPCGITAALTHDTLNVQ